MSHGITGFKPSVISDIEHNGLKEILSSPSNGIQGYKELKQWLEDTYNREIPYTTLAAYCIRKFSTKIKVACKSHTKKEEFIYFNLYFQDESRYGLFTKNGIVPL